MSGSNKGGVVSMRTPRPAALPVRVALQRVPGWALPSLWAGPALRGAAAEGQPDGAWSRCPQPGWQSCGCGWDAPLGFQGWATALLPPLPEKGLKRRFFQEEAQVPGATLKCPGGSRGRGQAGGGAPHPPRRCLPMSLGLPSHRPSPAGPPAKAGDSPRGRPTPTAACPPVEAGGGPTHPGRARAAHGGGQSHRPRASRVPPRPPDRDA